MNDYVCPLNERACRCDPNATDKKSHPCLLAKRIGKLIRLMGSSFEGEAIGAVTGLRRLMQTEGIAFNDLALLVENCDGRIEEKRYSDADAEVIFARGVGQGRIDEARYRPQAEPTEYYDADGEPQWHAIALYCQRHYESLEQKHREFIDDMTGNTLWRAPTEKQGKYLLSLFYRLGKGKL